MAKLTKCNVYLDSDFYEYVFDLCNGEDVFSLLGLIDDSTKYNSNIEITIKVKFDE